MAGKGDYVRTMRAWMRDVVSSPVAWLAMSLAFLVIALPVLTYGVAAVLVASCAGKQAKGEKFRCIAELKALWSEGTALRAFLFGLMEIAFALAAVVSLGSLAAAGATLWSRLAACVFLWVDAVWLLSGIYRYPLLAANRSMPFAQALAKSVLLTIANLPNVILMFMVSLFVLMLSVATGIMLFAFLPGGIALLHAYNFREIAGTE